MTAAAIDILLPFYGDPELMRLTVDSVRRQTDESWRLIVVDDGYPDESIPGWFEALDEDRIEYHRNETNLGANANYRRALSLATSEHIVFMGADDLLLPGYVARARKVLTETGATIYHPGVEVIDENGEPVRTVGDRIKTRLRPQVSEPTPLQGEPLAARLLRGNWTYFPAICWRRDAVESVYFREGLHVVQDLALLLDLVVSGHSLVLDPTTTFAYRRHSGSDSSVKALNGHRFAEERAYFMTMASEMQDRGWPRAAREARRHYTSRLNALSLIPTAARTGSPAAAAGLVRHGLGGWRGHASR